MQQISLSIRPIKEEFELNTPISMELIFENKSDKPIFFNGVFNVFRCSLQFDITMPSGEKPQETYTAAGKMSPLRKKDFIKLPSGKSYRKIIIINDRWYDLNQKGKYAISAIYSNSRNWSELQIKAWTGSVKSNTATFIIK